MRFFLPLLLSFLALFACGKDSAPTSGPTQLSQIPPQTLAENLRRKDPAADGWQTEVLHEAVKAPLGEFLEGFFPLVSPKESIEVRCSPLLPTQLKVVFQSEDVSVWRGDALSRQLTSAKDSEKLLQQLSDAVNSADIQRVDFKITRVLPIDKAFTTEAMIHVLGNREQTQIQWSLHWIMTWTLPTPDEPPILSSIQGLNYEQVQFPGANPEKPLFADRTGLLFQRHPFFKKDFLRGAHEYHRRQDRLDGFSFMGLQGMAVGDVNGDGLEDLYVAQAGGLPNRLFLHNPDGTTSEVAEAWGVDFLENTHGVLLVDLDSDGDKDFAAGIGHYVFIGYNLGDRFGDFAVLEGPDSSNVHSLCAADPDDDGDLDIYATHYSPTSDQGTLSARPKPYHNALNGGINSYWRNDGHRKWIDATEEVGLGQGNSRFSFSATWEDFDQDGDLDLFVANDYGPNHVYRNDNGKFSEVAAKIGMEGSAASMGLTFADYDLDGDTDLYISNMFSSAGQRITQFGEKFMAGAGDEVIKHYRRHARGNTLYANQGDGTFKDVTDETQTAIGRWAWGAHFLDYDNDGWEDIYVPNGFVTNTDTHDL